MKNIEGYDTYRIKPEFLKEREDTITVRSIKGRGVRKMASIKKAKM